MTVSFVVMLVPEALAEQRIAGRVEAVATGEQAIVRDAEDLIAFLIAHASRPARGGRPRPAPAPARRPSSDERAPEAE